MEGGEGGGGGWGGQRDPIQNYYTVKPVLSVHSKEDQKLVFKTDYRLLHVKSIAECPKGSILQYFRPALSLHLSLRPLFCLFLSGSLHLSLRPLFYLFLSGRLRQVLLYIHSKNDSYIQ